VSRIKVPVERLPHGQGLDLPEYMSDQAAGLDLPAALHEDLEIAPGDIVLVPTGLKLAIPDGHEGQVRPRSGLAVKKGLTVINAPGTIDADYRGEVKVGLINLSRQPVTIQRGERVAQLVIAPVVQARLEEVSHLPASQRGEGGFGHTGS
jgi:dUTP pyrophosphatase